MFAKFLLIGALATVPMAVTAEAGCESDKCNACRAGDCEDISGLYARYEPVPRAKLTDVAAQPHAYYKTKFEFEARFDKLSEIYQPFFTKFDKHSFVNFSAWDICQDISARENYMDNNPLLYMGRMRRRATEDLFELCKFQRFVGIAKVESIFGDKPFIEVIDIVPLDRHFCHGCHKEVAMAGTHSTSIEVPFETTDGATAVATNQPAPTAHSYPTPTPAVSFEEPVYYEESMPYTEPMSYEEPMTDEEFVSDDFKSASPTFEAEDSFEPQASEPAPMFAPLTNPNLPTPPQSFSKRAPASTPAARVFPAPSGTWNPFAGKNPQAGQQPLPTLKDTSSAGNKAQSEAQESQSEENENESESSDG